jgi:hypothetical protein
MLDGGMQERWVPKAGVGYALIVQADGSIFVRVGGSEPKSAVIGPFKDEAAALAWVREPPAMPFIKRRRPSRSVGRGTNRRVLGSGSPR